MPTILRIGSFRFFFYSNEGNEPPHIHVQEGNCLAKFWLDPVELATSVRFDSHHLTKLQKLILENKTSFLEAWNEYFT